MNRASILICCLAASLGAAPAFGADATAGKSLFLQRCSVCHTAESGDNGGAQGPSLVGVFGRAAASAPQFPYTVALRESKLTWDAENLNRYLAAPSAVVPGTAMLVAVPDDTERADLVAYFQNNLAAPVSAQPIEVPSSSSQSANWRLDAPGQVHRIGANSLPPAFATQSVRNNVSIVSQPAGATLAVPVGFHVDVFANGLSRPRKMLVAPNGDVLVTEMTAGRVTVLHPQADGRRAERTDVYLQGLKQPFGLAFYPNAQNPQWLYVAETNRITRYAYRNGDLKPRDNAQIIVAELPSGVGHSTRDLAFSPDGKKLFVSVGSGSNVAETMSKKTPEQIRAWEAEYALGAAWDVETNRATVLEYDAGHPAKAAIYAAGIRNCVSLTVQPANGELWCTTNERDALGDDLVPDYSTRVKRGSFYGWPWYYLGSNEDPRLKGERPDLAGKVSVPDVLYQSHSAALSMTFYVANRGKSAFPAAFVGDAFVGFHGSWNRSLRTGYKLIRVHMKNGEPTGDYEDFLTGFVVDDAHVWGRPVATAQLPDGSLLMSEDGSGVIYRISYGN
jgi:glucose/arabinose dehydrogenase/cytochrome c2